MNISRRRIESFQAAATALTVAIMLGACSTHADDSYPQDGELRLNQVQVLATHNSYKPSFDPARIDPATLPAGITLEQLSGALDYAHPSLTAQLSEDAVRSLEIDVWADHDGGRFTPADETDPGRLEKWGTPGLKVVHVPPIDPATTCILLTDCLTEINTWSNQNPGHVPVSVMIEIKDDDKVGGDGAIEHFTGTDYDELDETIRSVVPAGKLITPDQVRGDAANLREAVTTTGWPTLAQSRGKLIFANCNCLADDRQRVDYLRPDGSLDGRVMFPMSRPENPDAGFILLDDPVADFDEIQVLVAQGFIVRTRSDQNLVEARNGDHNRPERAFASGAQIVSTDFERENPSFPGYVIVMPGGTIARCNPVNTTATQCSPEAVEHR